MIHEPSLGVQCPVCVVSGGVAQLRLHALTSAVGCDTGLIPGQAVYIDADRAMVPIAGFGREAAVVRERDGLRVTRHG